MKRLRDILLLLASLVLLALLIAPQTRWLVGVQVGSALHLCRPFDRVFEDDYDGPTLTNFTGLAFVDRGRVQATLKRHPDSFPMQMASALPFSSATRDSAAHLRMLIPRFPNSPSLYANLLRCESFPTIRLNRPEIDTLDDEKPQEHSWEHVATPAELARYDDEAATGERLDLDNAYFPFMRSVGLFAAHSNPEGLVALQSACQKPLWKEYYSDEVQGHQQLYQEAFGNKSAINQAAFSAAICLPHYANLKHAAYFAVSQAIYEEKRGDIAHGIAIRQSLSHIGGLMRVQSSSVIGITTGIAIAKIAELHNNKIDANATREARAEYAAGQTARHLLQLDESSDGTPNRVLALGPFGEPMGLLLAWWTADICVLYNILWTLLLGWLAARFASSRHLRENKPLPLSMQVVAVLIFLAVAAMSGFAAWWQSDTLMDLKEVIGTLSSDNNQLFSDLREVYIALFSLYSFLAVPCLTLVVLTSVCLIRRIPLAVGLVRGFRTATLPIACLLAVVYGGMVLGTARQERVVSHGLAQMRQQGVGPYYASLIGQPWPGAAH